MAIKKFTQVKFTSWLGLNTTLFSWQCLTHHNMSLGRMQCRSDRLRSQETSRDSIPSGRPQQNIWNHHHIVHQSQLRRRLGEFRTPAQEPHEDIQQQEANRGEPDGRQEVQDGGGRGPGQPEAGQRRRGVRVHLRKEFLSIEPKGRRGTRSCARCPATTSIVLNVNKYFRGRRVREVNAWTALVLSAN